jgi:hypothetical protein
MGNWEWGFGNIPFFPFAFQKKLLRLSQQFSKNGGGVATAPEEIAKTITTSSGNFS